MQDRSHKLLFLAATGAMCAAVLYGSNAVTALPLPQEPSRAADGLGPGAIGPDIPGNAGASRLPDRAGTSVLSDQAGASILPEKAGASVLPNSASCPEAGALAAPPRANTAPAGTVGASAQARANSNLGTGTACPELRADAAKSGALALPGLAPGQTSPNTAPPHP